MAYIFAVEQRARFAVVLALAVTTCGCAKDPASQNGALVQGSVNYRVAQQWQIPNGGFGRVIVIGPAHRNEADMLSLGYQLKQDTRHDRNAFVFIYDDARAASLRTAALDESLNEDSSAHHDSHMIGTYFRNANTGYHALTITLQGLLGPAKEIKL